MQTTREPYEFLARWIPAGVPGNQYAGSVQAQVNFAFVARDDDNVVVSWTPDPKGPFHVALSGPDGIALGDFIPGLNAATVEALAASEADHALTSAILAERTNQLSEASGELTATQSALADAERQIADKDETIAANAATAAAALAQAHATIVALQAEIAALQSPAAGSAKVSRMQALLALHDLGLLDAVKAIVAAADARTQLAWDTATDFHRSSPTIAALWAQLGRTPEQLDDLFALAVQIEV